MKKFIRVRIQLIDAKGGPEDPGIEECDTFFFYPRSKTFWPFLQMVRLGKYIGRLIKELEREEDQ